MTERPDYVYVTYIEATPEKVWEALTDTDLTVAYWGHANVSDWQPGSTWEHRRTDGSGTADVAGSVIESRPPWRLVTTWAAPGRDRPVGPSLVTFDIEAQGGMVRLTVTHGNFLDEAEREDAAAGWPAVISNLKSLLETGSPLPQEPWRMPHAARPRATQKGGGRPDESLLLTRAPSVDVGMLMRRPAHDVFEAMVDPSITTRFWYTKSSGRMESGADLTWEWEMYGVGSTVRVQAVEDDRRIVFTWSGYDPEHPTTVELIFLPWKEDSTWLRITETGFSGDADTRVQRVVDSTTGFTFLLSALKAALEHDIDLHLVLDAHPEGLQV